MNGRGQRIRTLLLLAALFAGCRAEPLPEIHAGTTKDVALVALIATPDAWHGKHVRVVGFYHSGLEESGLYMHQADFNEAITKNAIWLDMAKENRDLSGRYVLVEGVFDADYEGHLSLYSGTLRDVRRMEARTPERRPEGGR
jgi:hypothetical protein